MLVAVLWTTVAVAACALGAAVAGREAVAAAANRVALTRAAWRAEACVARVLAAADAALAERSFGAAQSPLPSFGGTSVDTAAWSDLDRRVLANALVTGPATLPNGGQSNDAGGPGCDVRVASAGAAVNLNTADAPALRALFTALGVPATHADSVAAAIVRRRDPATGGRAFAAAAELEQVPGTDSASLAAIAPTLDPAWRTMVGVDSERVDLLHAPIPVLASVPGVTPEAVEVLRAGNPSRGGPGIHDFADLVARLSPPGRAALLAQAPAFLTRATFDPDAWTVTARASSAPRAAVGVPVVTAVLEIRLVRAGRRVAVVRRRTWVE